MEILSLTDYENTSYINQIIWHISKIILKFEIAVFTQENRASTHSIGNLRYKTLEKINITTNITDQIRKPFHHKRVDRITQETV